MSGRGRAEAFFIHQNFYIIGKIGQIQSFLEFSCRLRHFEKHMFIYRQATTFDLYHHLLILVSAHIQSPIAKFYSCASPSESSIFVCVAYKKNVCPSYVSLNMLFPFLCRTTNNDKFICIIASVARRLYYLFLCVTTRE